jgi:hypothetical protein
LCLNIYFSYPFVFTNHFLFLHFPSNYFDVFNASFLFYYKIIKYNFAVYSITYLSIVIFTSYCKSYTFFAWHLLIKTYLVIIRKSNPLLLNFCIIFHCVLSTCLIYLPSRGNLKCLSLNNATWIVKHIVTLFYTASSHPSYILVSYTWDPFYYLLIVSFLMFPYFQGPFE